jgi:hypothetical protein
MAETFSTQRKTPKSKGLIVFFCFLLLVPVWYINNQYQEKKTRLANSAAEAAAKSEHAKFGRTNGAVINWIDKLPARPGFRLYSADVADALMSNGRPILFRAVFDDVGFEDGSYNTRFTCRESGIPVILLLKTTADQANKLRRDAPNLWQEFSVVANIHQMKTVETHSGDFDHEVELLCQGVLVNYQQCDPFDLSPRRLKKDAF